nr:aspartyl protease family protein [uncultured Psychroserpens sp.]
MSITIFYGQGKFVLPSKQQDKIKFKLINNLIVLPIEINGVELSFLLDTGVSKPILFNITNTDSLQMNNVETIFLRGLGAGETVKALRSRNNFLKVGSAVNVNQELYVVFDQEINFTPRLGVPVHGIIGYSLFKDFVVEINYKSKYIKLNKRESYVFKSCRKCQTYNLSFHNNKPYIDGEVTLGEKTLPVKLLIDTGSSDALWLFEDSDHGITAENNNYFQDFLGRGLSGNVHGKRSKISAFKLKDFILKDVNAAFPDSIAIKHAKRIENRNGSLSAEILRRFNVIFDYENAKLILKKNSNYKDEFRYNRSGIVLEQRGFRVVKEIVNKKSIDNYGRSNDDNIVIKTAQFYRMGLKPAYTIIEVRKGSPAEKVGLLPNDIILTINGKQTHELKLQEVNRYFREKIGKTIKLKIERDTNLISVEFKLEDVFKKKELPN